MISIRLHLLVLVSVLAIVGSEAVVWLLKERELGAVTQVLHLAEVEQAFLRASQERHLLRHTLNQEDAPAQMMLAVSLDPLADLRPALPPALRPSLDRVRESTALLELTVSQFLEKFKIFTHQSRSLAALGQSVIRQARERCAPLPEVQAEGVVNGLLAWTVGLDSLVVTDLSTAGDPARFSANAALALEGLGQAARRAEALCAPSSRDPSFAALTEESRTLASALVDSWKGMDALDLTVIGLERRVTHALRELRETLERSRQDQSLRLRVLALAIPFCFLLGLGLVAWGVVRSITRPLNVLMSYATRLGQRELDLPRPMLDTYEFRRLGETLDQMRRNLRAGRDTLETRVRERTHRLEQEIETRRQVEVQLQTVAARADAANHAKNAFLATISHEIRTPLNAILGMTHLVLESSLSARQRDQVHTIHDAGQALLALIDDILDYSRLEAGVLSFEDVAFDLDTVMTAASALIAARAREKNLPVTITVAPGTPSTVRGDPKRLRQVLVNLMDNAVKFTQQGEITLGVDVLFRNDTHATLRFCVRDTGIGMDTDQCEGLFQPFTQLDASTTRRYGGTGLGLALVNRLVSMMGGTIHIDSAPDQGTDVYFSARFGLEADVMPPVGTPDPTSPPAPGANDAPVYYLPAAGTVQRTLLERLAHGQGAAATRVAVLLEQGDTKAAEALVHTIKGTAALLGAMPLASAATPLLQALRADDATGARRTLPAFAAALAALERLCRAPGPAEAPFPADATLPEGADPALIIAHLNEAVAAFDPCAYDLLIENRAILGSVLPPEDLDRLFSLIGDFAFDEARPILESLKRRLFPPESPPA
ncbi:sensor histidine kinase [Pararhodospirillum oryzae]|uniref:histidine kinase n=1 Tax=Pararhodospirillum oryzae TaxID=478448 RepID=A0A512HC28_9PROT|nr:sensor histidine kinase [Pararhodospirillum oryzae]GEO83007.1 hypothetical protein ROR02_31380 [Pararhodospirillum oryzae]